MYSNLIAETARENLSTKINTVLEAGLFNPPVRLSLQTPCLNLITSSENRTEIKLYSYFLEKLLVTTSKLEGDKALASPCLKN